VDRFGCSKKVGVINVIKVVINAFFRVSILCQIFIPKGGRIYNKSNKVTHRRYDVQIIGEIFYLIGCAVFGGLIGHLAGMLL